MVRRPSDRTRGRRVRVDVRWLEGIIEDPQLALELSPEARRRLLSTTSIAYARSLCLRCKGKGLCGRPDCPFLKAMKLFSSYMPDLDSTELEGNSPPAVFVGRFGYPYVSVGPLIPPVLANTAHMDMPEEWYGLPLAEIVRMRTSLVRGRFIVDVRRPERAGKLMERTLELALSRRPVSSEAYFIRRPKKVIILDEGIQPFGPTAPLRALEVDVSRWDHRLERAYSDTDLRASEAVLWLYEREVPISKIQRAFSVGALGLGRLRRLVPTRWSITAVDSIISKHLASKVKSYPLIKEFQAYHASYLDNHYVVILMPDSWAYELLEAWSPGAIWNPNDRIVFCSDWEGWRGRASYAKPGGSYYAARLAVCEALERMRKQARVVVLREVRPGYMFPVGVWQVREAIRAALRSRPFRSDDIREVLSYAASKLTIPIRAWVRASRLLRSALEQVKLTAFFSSS